jgi:hypothetical protein
LRRITASVLMALVTVGAPAVAQADTTERNAGDCRLGKVVAQQTLLSPKAATFYSVDALNPDVVRRGRMYYMFFSGNQVHTAAGDWRTGVATARSPLGPFRVRRWLQGNFLNGGTVVRNGRFWQAYSHNERGGELAVSRNGRAWRRVAAIPSLSAFGWPVSADYSLQRVRGALRMYMLVRPAPVGLGGSLASIDWTRQGWRRFRVLLSPSAEPWENADLGEPASIRIGSTHLLLYTATAAGDAVRSIGLAARATPAHWKRCGNRPLIAPGAPWGPAVSIDPSPLRVGNKLYVYYGGGLSNSIASDLAGAIGVRVYKLRRSGEAKR